MRQRSVLVLSFCLIFISFSAKAQQNESLNNGYIPELKISVFSPFSLLDLKPYLEASLEKRMYQRNTIEFALGIYTPNHISDKDALDREEDIHRSGFRLRVNWKWYEKQFKSRPHYNSYFGPEFLFNYSVYTSSNWYSRFEDAYQEYLSPTSKTIAMGIGFKVGEQYYTKNNKFYIDQFMGLGIRTQQVSFKNAPEDISAETNDGMIGRADGLYFLPYIILGIKLGIVLKK